MRKIDPIISQTVNFLRFPLMALVLMIHANFLNLSFGGSNLELNYSNFPVLNNVVNLCSPMIASAAVPLFFAISGYMFFWGIDTFDKGVFINKLKRRVRSLLLPYLLWNLAVIVLFFLAQTFLPDMMSGANKMIVEYDIHDYICAFWADPRTGDPICFQLWFLRDLMVTVLFAPLIYIALKKFGFYAISIFFLLWLLPVETGIKGVSFVAISFFSLGGYLAIDEINPIDWLSEHSKIFGSIFGLLLIFLVAEYNLGEGVYPEWCDVLRRIFTMIEVPCFFYLAYKCTSKYELIINETLTRSSFFLYCFHGMPLALVLKMLLKVLQPSTEILTIIIYFVAPVIIIGVSTAIYTIMRRACPNVLNVITGAR